MFHIQTPWDRNEGDSHEVVILKKSLVLSPIFISMFRVFQSHDIASGKCLQFANWNITI